MRMFALVIIAAVIIGGFVGGEIFGTSFSLTSAVAGGVGTFAVLMGLGAYFSSQEEKKTASNLPPEIRGVFDRMLKPSDETVVTSTIVNLIEQDREEFRAGRVPDRRLIPHHAIKRDIILEAFNIDYFRLNDRMQELNKADFEEKIAGIKQMHHTELDGILNVMSDERTDLVDIENHVRQSKTGYIIVPRLFD